MSSSDAANSVHRRRRHRKHQRLRCTVVNPDENFYFYWLFLLSLCVLYNLWTMIVRQSFPELQDKADSFWFICDVFSDVVYLLDIGVQFRTGYLEQGLMVYDCKKLARHYICSRAFFLDCASLIPLDLLQYNLGTQPMLRFPRFLKVSIVFLKLSTLIISDQLSLMYIYMSHSILTQKSPICFINKNVNVIQRLI